MEGEVVGELRVLYCMKLLAVGTHLPGKDCHLGFFLLEEKGVAVHRKLYCNSPFSHQSQGLDPNKPSLQILGPEKSRIHIPWICQRPYR